jgi:hypothetical protein
LHAESFVKAKLVDNFIGGVGTPPRPMCYTESMLYILIVFAFFFTYVFLWFILLGLVEIKQSIEKLKGSLHPKGGGTWEYEKPKPKE